MSDRSDLKSAEAGAAPPSASVQGSVPRASRGSIRLASAAFHLADRAMDAAASQGARDARTIDALRAELAAQALQMQAQADSFAQQRSLFDRASAAARIGLWECDLPSEILRWSDTVHDLFEFPRGVAPRRRDSLDCYTEETRRQLVAARSEAIARGSAFTLDTEIVGRQGGQRWIRITATVECRDRVPVRIFGLKQDITIEKLHGDRMRLRADYDGMTGLANRTVFEARLAAMGETATLLLIDLDGFKTINDTHGHAVGDACLQEAARRLAETCRGTDLVARIGGDEFAVLVARDASGSASEALGRRIVEAMRRPFAYRAEHLRFGASVGIARADQAAPAEVFVRADCALYAAKAAGRGTVRVAPPWLGPGTDGATSTGN